MGDTIGRRAFVGGAAALALLPGCAARMGPAAATTRAHGSVRVLTLNLAHGRARALVQSRARTAAWYRGNLDVVAEVLRRERPDVVALQEAELGSRWAGMFDHVAYLAERSGLDVVSTTPFVHAPGRWRYGTALLANAEVLSRGGAGFVAHGRWAKGFSTARVRLAATDAMVASLHLDHASAALRRQQVGELGDALAAATGPYIVLGDFNADWHADDNPVRALARRLGLRVHDPRAAGPSTYPRMGKRLDWILASPEFAFVGHRVLVDDRLSDHCAVLADLRLD